MPSEEDDIKLIPKLDVRECLFSYKWTSSLGFYMTWITTFLENSLPSLLDGLGHRERLNVLF